VTTGDVFEAIAEGDVERVLALVEADPAVASERNEQGTTSLLQARYHGRLEIVEVLRTARGALDVHEASALGDVDRVRELVDADPELVKRYADDGFYPLGLAAFFGHADVVAFLLERGADATQRARNQLAVMALHAAAATDQTAIARTMLDAGAPVGSPQQDRYTPLHEAAANGNVELVALLLERGADPSARLDDGRAPADLAAEKGHDELAERLLVSEAGGLRPRTA
jgi:ankyrin repeat protein